MTLQGRRTVDFGPWGRAVALFAAIVVTGCANAGPTGSETAAATAPEPASSGLGAYLAGRVAETEQDYDSAADYMMRALADDPQNPALLESALKLLIGAGRVAEARDVAGRLVEIDPRSAGAQIVLALGDLDQGRYDEAERRLADVPAQGLNSFVVPTIRAWIASAKGEPDRALATLGPVGGQQGFEAVYQLNVGLINDVAGRPQPAEEAFAKALASAETPPFRLVQIAGGFYERTGRTDKAREVYQRFSEANQGSALIEPILERAAVGQSPEAVVADASDGVAESLFNLASALYQERLLEPALLYTRLALDLRPDLAVAQILLGDLLDADERHSEAAAAYRAVASNSPFYWAARLRAAESLAKQQRTDEAIGELDQLSEERPDRADALIQQGNLLRGEERFPEAVDAYDRALQRIGKPDRRHWTLLYFRGVALQRSDEWTRAEQDFLKALELQPDEPHVLNYLAYSWVEMGQNYDRALDMLAKAVALKPEDGFIVDSLGWVFYRLGRYDEAVTELERAIELRPQDPVINDHLGDAYWKVGRHHEARYQWQRALSFEPEADQVQPIQVKLERGLSGSPSGG